MNGGPRARGGVRAGLVAAALALASLATSCAGRKEVIVDFSETPRHFVAKDYEDVYKRWTRHQQVLDEADVALEAWGTFKSWEFREAYVELYADIYSLSESDHATLRTAQQEAFRAAYEFHVTAQSTSFKWNDLEKSSSAWRTTLVDALGHELPADSIKVVKLPDAYERAFFPQKTPFTKTYAIRFVPSGDVEFVGMRSGSIRLRIASPIGRVELVWRSS
jgi:hypothetical protein